MAGVAGRCRSRNFESEKRVRRKGRLVIAGKRGQGVPPLPALVV
jgi:hypothetical protein